MKLKLKALTTLLIASTSFINYSCIDHDYDLTKNIDMTIAIGGNEFAIPGGKTEEIQLSKILKVNEGNMVKIDPETGDYYLLQYGDPSDTNVFIEGFDLNCPIINPVVESLIFKRNVNQFGESIFEPDDLPETKSTFEIEAKLPYEIKSLSYIEVDINAVFNFKYSSADIKKLQANELKLTFPNYITSSDLTNNAKVIQNEIIQNEEVFRLPITIQGVKISSDDLTTNIDGSLSLHLKTDINYTGTFSVLESDVTTGNTVSANLNIDISLDKLEAISVTGIIKPDIDIKIDPIDLEDLPDYLSGNEVRLDIINPMILFDIDNASPISASIDGTFTSVYENKNNDVVVPFAVPDIKANFYQAYCISPHNPNIADKIWIETPGLPSLITRIPNLLNIAVAATPSDNVSTVTLGKTYNVKTNYAICVPFVYGEGMNIVYTDTMSGWHEDLKKYDVSQINATGYAVNKIPLNLNIVATAVKVNSKGELEPLDGIKVTVSIDGTIDGTINAGDIITGSKSAVLIELKQTISGSVKQLDGLILEAFCNSKEVEEGRLNANQTFQLIDVKLKVPGGLIIDLNE